MWMSFWINTSYKALFAFLLAHMMIDVSTEIP